LKASITTAGHSFQQNPQAPPDFHPPTFTIAAHASGETKSSTIDILTDSYRHSSL
jgi:hypothetical protein